MNENEAEIIFTELRELKKLNINIIKQITHFEKMIKFSLVLNNVMVSDNQKLTIKEEKNNE